MGADAAFRRRLSLCMALCMAAVGTEGAYGVAPAVARFGGGMAYTSCRTVRTVMPENWDSYEVHSRFVPGDAAEDFGEEDPRQYQTKGMPQLIFLPQSGLLGQNPQADAEARFKAKVLSQFVLHNQLKHVVELEYGYSSTAYHQLTQFPSYRGFEANKHTWSHFNQLLSGEANKQFELYTGYKPPPDATGDVCLSIGVIPHLETVREVKDHLAALFACARQYVIVFSSDFAEQSAPFHMGGIINRHFTDIVEHDFGHKWRLLGTLVNRFPNQQPYDFFIYKNARWEYDCKAKNGDVGAVDDEMETFTWWLSDSTGASPAAEGSRYGAAARVAAGASPVSLGGARTAAAASMAQLGSMGGGHASGVSGVERAARGMGGHTYHGAVRHVGGAMVGRKHLR